MQHASEIVSERYGIDAVYRCAVDHCTLPLSSSSFSVYHLSLYRTVVAEKKIEVGKRARYSTDFEPASFGDEKVCKGRHRAFVTRDGAFNHQFRLYKSTQLEHWLEVRDVWHTTRSSRYSFSFFPQFSRLLTKNLLITPVFQRRCMYCASYKKKSPNISHLYFVGPEKATLFSVGKK